LSTAARSINSTNAQPTNAGTKDTLNITTNTTENATNTIGNATATTENVYINETFVPSATTRVKRNNVANGQNKENGKSEEWWFILIVIASSFLIILALVFVVLVFRHKKNNGVWFKGPFISL
jgi:ATP-dependent Zn protease